MTCGRCRLSQGQLRDVMYRHVVLFIFGPNSAAFALAHDFSSVVASRPLFVCHPSPSVRSSHDDDGPKVSLILSFLLLPPFSSFIFPVNAHSAPAPTRPPAAAAAVGGID